MIIRYLVSLVGKARYFRESALIFVLDAFVLFMAAILIYSFFVKRNMFFEFLEIASIILIPLGILIISLDIDLHSDKRDTDREISRLSGVSSSAQRKMGDNSPELNSDYTHEDSVIAHRKEAYIDAERELLHKKVKIFEISSIIAYVLVIATLCILPFLSLIGFNWGWK